MANLREIVGLENLNTSHVVDMSCMFCGCGVEELDLRSFNTSRVEGMTQMFCDCPWLELLDVSNFSLRNLKHADDFMDGCDALQMFCDNQAISQMLDMQKPKKRKRCRARSI